MEIIRKMALTRRRTAWIPRVLAAVMAAGAAPSVAHAQEPAVSVEAPRAQVQAPPSPLSVLPDAAQAAAFRMSSATAPIAGQPQPMPPGDGSGTSATLSAPTATAPVAAPANPWQPMVTTAPQFPAAMAPAWRWHGYGAVAPTETIQPSTPATVTSQRPGSPTGGAVAPTGSDVNLGAEWKQPQAVPAFLPPADPISPPSAVQPLSAAEPAWRSGIQRVGYTSANPMTAGPDSWQAAPSTPVVVMTAAEQWHGPAVTLDAPRPAGTYISRAVSDAAVQPASFSPPAPVKVQPTAVLPAVRTGIERACAGRVRDVEIVTRGSASLLVRLKVRQAADAEYVANAIARLPELGPYQVLFEMQVVR